ncbi:MAG: DUF1566 domain-containing protein [Gammaproteobacteria bacterium]|nr:DUF1566 domain-containing protein [Gammaproteobacteria bacterium]
MINLRSYPQDLSKEDVRSRLKDLNIYDGALNSEGKGIAHSYRKGKKVIFDEATGLMWQQCGSGNQLTFDEAVEYINKLNKKKFRGYKDWRLPTLEEAMSLMEPSTMVGNSIDPLFDIKQKNIWTSDKEKAELSPWVVYFFKNGCCGFFDKNLPIAHYKYWRHFVRAVRSGQSS